MKSYVYECNNSGKCCEYGFRKTCKECNALKCSPPIKPTSPTPIPSIPGPPRDPPARAGDGSGRWNSQKKSANDLIFEKTALQEIKLEVKVAGHIAWKYTFMTLAHYLDNTGQTLTIAPETIMKDLPKFKQVVGDLVRKETAKAYKDITRTGGSKAFTSVWNGFTAASGDWKYALHGFSYSVTGVVTKSNGKKSIKYKVHIFDRYNWDGNKSFKIPPIGPTVKEAVLGKLHLLGLAKEYFVRGSSKEY